jgi:hypothetical protein
LGALVLAAGCSFNINGLAPEDGAVGADDLAVSIDLAMGTPDDLATPPVGDMAMPLPPDMAKKGRRKKLTVDIAKVNGNQTDFPVWIDLTDANIGARAQANGSDIYFTAADGTTVLDYQITRWDAAGQRLNAWVRIPSLPANPATSFYVYYGDPAATATPNAAGVFKSSFAAVWHLDDTLPATAIADATGTHPGTPTLANTTQTAAKLGGGLAFTGSTDTITFTNPLSGNMAHTISVWVSQAAATHVSAILVVGTAATDQSRFLYSHFTTAVMGAGYYNDDWTTTDNLDGDGLVLVHWVLEGPNGKNHLYVNGAEITGSPTTISGINTQGTAGVIGHAPEPAYGTNTGLLGTIDELRIATVARSAGWIATEYANQSSPSTFYTVGAEEVAP